MRPKGLEPPAHCLEGSCSIQLSYGRIAVLALSMGHAAYDIIATRGPVVNSFFQKKWIYFFSAPGQKARRASAAQGYLPGTAHRMG